MKVVLTIAGSDPSGGAGIQADIKTFNEIGVFGMAVITSVTAQNSKEVSGIYDIPPNFVYLQIKTLFDSFKIRYAKIGMLHRKDIIKAVIKAVNKFSIKTVVDPVVVSGSGTPLLMPSALSTLKELISISYLVTPNISEAELLSGIKIKSISDVKESAKKIKSLGVKYVVVKGGHLDLGLGVKQDIFYDGLDFRSVKGRVVSGKFHGAGCTFSSALAAYLAIGNSPYESFRKAKRFVENAMKKGFLFPGKVKVLRHFKNGGGDGI